jgi:hypothetical protein
MSGYPGEMQGSLRLVEETRQQRLGESFQHGPSGSARAEASRWPTRWQTS